MLTGLIWDNYTILFIFTEQNKNIIGSSIKECIMNCIDYIVSFVIVFTGNIHTVLEDMDLAAKCDFLRECEHCYFTIY